MVCCNSCTNNILDKTQTFDYLPELIPLGRVAAPGRDQNSSEAAVLPDKTKDENKDETIVAATRKEVVKEEEREKRVTNTESGEGNSNVR